MLGGSRGPALLAHPVPIAPSLFVRVLAGCADRRVNRKAGFIEKVLKKIHRCNRDEGAGDICKPEAKLWSLKINLCFSRC